MKIPMLGDQLSVIQRSWVVSLEMDINTLGFFASAHFKSMDEMEPLRELDLKTREELFKLLKQRKSQRNIKKTFLCS